MSEGSLSQFFCLYESFVMNKSFLRVASCLKKNKSKAAPKAPYSACLKSGGSPFVTKTKFMRNF